MRTAILLLCLGFAGTSSAQYTDPSVDPKRAAAEAEALRRATEGDVNNQARPAAVVASFPLGDMPQDKERIWTDAKGKTLKGILAKIEITVELKLTGGRSVRVPLERLSSADQQAIRKRIALLPDSPGLKAAPPIAATIMPQPHQVAPWTRDRSSDELRRDAIGQSRESVVLWLGPPKETTDTGDEKRLVYEDIAVDSDSHKSVGAVVIVEKERVTRVIFH